jgi:hypothetical protein
MRFLELAALYTLHLVLRQPKAATALLILLYSSQPVSGQTTLDQIGVTQLRALDPTLTGTGVYVAQPEATTVISGTDQNDFEVNPDAVGQSQSLFTYINSSGSTATVFPNSVGSESGHGDAVGSNFYGSSSGVAPGVSHVDNYDANYFYSNIIEPSVFGIPPRISAKIVNQSFIFGSQDATVDQNYDNYVARYNTIFVSGIGNGGAVNSPATSYNGIGVAAYGGASSVGPTSDGRSKPDITAPAGATSFSTPLVAGAAAILVEAGLRGDAGTGTTSDATNSRTIKALLLNGASKPNDWTHTTTAPLDARYGSGVVNIYNSYLELKAGEYSYTSSAISTSGSAHLPPRNVTASIPSLSGWDFNTITRPRSNTASDVTNHYFFDLSSSPGNEYQLTSTLTWNRNLNQSSINNLDLYLYNVDTLISTLLSSSVSTVDNVEQIFVSGLAPGRYDLEVFKPTSGALTASETYALAFDFTPVPEPSSLLLLTFGAVAIVFVRQRYTQ